MLNLAFDRILVSIFRVFQSPIQHFCNNVYRVRIGDYRLFYSFGQGWVKLLSVRKRDERTYEIELPEVDSPAPPPAESILKRLPDGEVDSSGGREVERSRGISPTPDSQLPIPDSPTITTALPFQLTETLLKQWQIPSEHWPGILAAPHSEALLELPIPDHYLQRIIYVQTYGKPIFAREDQCLALLDVALRTAEIPAKNSFDRQGRRQSLERLGLPYLLQEIQDVIEGWGVTSLEDYLALDRRGRGAPLQAKLREALWSIYQTWQKLMERDGYITWPQLRCKALAVVEQLAESPYQAVVIDEAQDLSPVSLRFLLALVPSLEGVYLTADASQSLYQRGFSWKQIHADLKVTGRTLLLKRNYRNTEQIIAACATILEGTSAGDAECLAQEPSAYQGEIPTIILTDSVEQESRLIHSFFIEAAKRCRLPLHGGAVLCPSVAMGKAIAQRLVKQGAEAQFVAGNDIDLNATYIKVMTLHSAKGLEFPYVAVVGLREGTLPYMGADLPEDEMKSVSDEQRRLFYVGCSRAMRALLVSGSRSNPSSFLEGLSAPYWKK